VPDNVNTPVACPTCRAAIPMPGVPPYAGASMPPAGFPAPGGDWQQTPPLPAPGRCPKCGSDQATMPKFTLWGGVIGPKLLHHVRCDRCGTTYNQKSGQSNLMNIILYQAVIVGILLVLGVVFAVANR
jgi:DNA-directed RNA polymerase subunit RPC12/RpoP